MAPLAYLGQAISKVKFESEWFAKKGGALLALLQSTVVTLTRN
jgi:hypothetical protein